MKTKSLHRRTKLGVDSHGTQSTASTTKVRFNLKSRLAHEVFLAGDFNDWNPANLPLECHDGDSWAAEIELPPGTHEYLFVVDGNWETDPGADIVPNPFGTRNSVIYVPHPKRLRQSAKKARSLDIRTETPRGIAFGHNGSRPAAS